MSQLRPEDIEKRLREADAPSPPVDLLDRLQEQIPERSVVAGFPGDAEVHRASANRGRWLVAASIAVALIGGSLAWRVARQADDPAAVMVGKARQEAGYPPEASAADDLAISDEATPTGEDAEAFETRKTVVDTRESEAVEGDAGPPREAALPIAESPDPALAPSAATTRPEVKLRSDPAEERQRVQQADPYVKDTTPSSLADQVPPRRAPRTVMSESSLLLPEAAPEEPASVVAPQAFRSVVKPRSAPLSTEPPSTGGIAEPNDLPYGDMFFQSYGVNPFIDTEDDNLSTFGLDVDTGAYTMARSYIERGHLPPAEAIRVEEMVNFFDYGDPPPTDGDFGITAEGAATPFADGPRYRLLRFNVRGREVEADERLPATLTFVVDVSGSMDRENRLGLVKRSLGLLLDQLRPEDRVGLVVYGDRGEVLLEPTEDLERIRSAIGRLRPGGSTNAEEGLVLAYELAERHYRDRGINRVVLCSDGVANVGRTGPDSILRRIGSAAERGVELTIVGFGMGNYNDVLMEQLADRGDGNYAYVDSVDEARRVFVEELTGTLQTIARDAKVQVQFHPTTVSRYRLLGYENRDIGDQRFRDDTVDAGEIGAGHSVTALYEIKLRELVRPDDELAIVRLRYHSVEQDEVVETAESLRVGELASSWDEASPSLRLASLVAEHAEILQRSFWAKEGDLDDVFRRSQELSPEFPGDVKVAELVGLIGRAAELAPRELPALALEDQ